MLFSKIKILIISLFVISTIVSSQTIVQWYTSMGNFKAELREDLVPITANNFIDLTNANFYDNLIFHRVIEGFMIQDGCPLGTGTGGPGYSIPDEFHPDLDHNAPGMLSMANAGPDTGGSQYFITVDSYPHLNDVHAVFGKIVEGMDIVYNISYVETNDDDRPVTPVEIDSIRVVINIPDEGVYVQNNIDDKIFLYNDELDIDLSNIFADVEGNTVTVSLESNSSPDVLSAIINGNILTITAGNTIQGTSTISLKGTAGEFFDTEEFTVSVYDPLTYHVEDFETGGFIKYPWDFEGSYPWVIETEYPKEGSYCIQSPNISGGETVNISLEMNYETEGSVTYWHRISSQEDSDFFKFLIDRDVQESISGVFTWRESSFSVPAGMHTFRWRYMKDSSGDFGNDCVWLDKITFEGGYPTSIDNGQLTMDNLELHQNYPNPFNPSTEISFSLDRSQEVKLSVYNLSGQLVKELVNGVVNAGMHSATFNASELNSGIYFYTLECEGFSETNKMLLIK